MIFVKNKLKLNRKNIVIIPLMLLLTGCVLFNENKTYNFYDTVNFEKPNPMEFSIENCVEITEEEMQRCFNEAYGWTKLKRHQLVWDEQNKQLVLFFEFEEDAPLWQITSSRKYVIDTYIYKQLYTLSSPQEYQIWAREHSINKLYAHIYINDKMFMQDYYGEIEEQSVTEEFHYENTEIFLPEQIYNPEKESELKTVIKKQCPTKNTKIIFFSDITKEDIVVNIICEGQVDPNNLEVIKKELKSLCEDEIEVTLQLYDEETNKMYYRETICE